MRVVALAAVLLTTAGPAAAHEAKKGALTVVHPLVRASLGRAPNTAAYFMVRNDGSAPDRLVGASCACAASVQIHGHEMAGGVARMVPVASVEAPAKGHVSFEPGGWHLMLTGLKRPLESGTVVEVTLRFQRAGTVKVPFFITSRVEQELKAHGHGGHAH